MSCAREGCSCPVGEPRFESGGVFYCCKKCANVRTDHHRVCDPSACKPS